ncbi:MAG: aldehyde dehydrogenase family protein [Planctomycetes bacterium]|nr:aldehyde dehydrogenase family protein [Planctomycetota bacterium]
MSGPGPRAKRAEDGPRRHDGRRSRLVDCRAHANARNARSRPPRQRNRRPVQLFNPSTDEAVAEIRSGGIDSRRRARAYARGSEVQPCGPFIRRARRFLLKALSAAIHAERENLIELSILNAARPGRRQVRHRRRYRDPAYYAALGSLGDRRFSPTVTAPNWGARRFWGQHVLVPPRAAVHINAFNFPAWNMMEKAACALLAGVPVVEKPGTSTALLAARIARIVPTAGLLPARAWQFIAGSVGGPVRPPRRPGRHRLHRQFAHRGRGAGTSQRRGKERA